MEDKITAIILCRNGAATLAAALQSVSFCSHVIVGDDASTDDSIAIAKHHKADVIKVPGNMDFSQKRNFLMQYVQTDWIFFVDTDEVVSPELAKAVRKELQHPGANGYLVQRVDTFLGRRLSHGETAHMWLLRLARRSAGKWEGPVHETWRIAGKVEKISGVLDHYSHPNLEEFFEKINRYTDLEAGKRAPKTPYSVAILQLLTYPIGKFVQNYVVRMGFLDGYPGLCMAWMMSFHSLCVRIKVLERIRQSMIV